MTAYVLYIASAVGAVALLLMMPRRGYTPWRFGLLLGAVALGLGWLLLGRQMPGPSGLPAGAFPYYYVFSAIAIGAAARVITHTRPVYCALWFVMVVLASAGLFVILSAEFMAFAMLIIYGGAILVTYLFVIMLASQSGGAGVVHSLAAEDPAAEGVDDEDAADQDEAAVYDRVAWEPTIAIAVSFVFLAVLLGVLFEPMAANPHAGAAARGVTDTDIIEKYLPRRAAAAIAEPLSHDQAAAMAEAGFVNPDRLGNVERVGFDLFRSHPLGLELAGVILLVALVGAVVIARQKVEAQGVGH